MFELSFQKFCVKNFCRKRGLRRSSFGHPSGKQGSKQNQGLEPHHWGWKEGNVYSRENR